VGSGDGIVRGLCARSRTLASITDHLLLSIFSIKIVVKRGSGGRMWVLRIGCLLLSSNRARVPRGLLQLRLSGRELVRVMCILVVVLVGILPI